MGYTLHEIERVPGASQPLADVVYYHRANAILWRLALADGLVSAGDLRADIDIEGLVQRAEASLQRLQELYAAWDAIMED